MRNLLDREAKKLKYPLMFKGTGHDFRLHKFFFMHTKKFLF